MKIEDVLKRLEALSDPKAVEGMARFGITGKCVYGVSIPKLRALAKEIGRNQEFSLELWTHESRETRILASLVGDPRDVTDRQMEEWVKDFDSWDLCDQVIMNLFEKTGHAYRKAFEWYRRDEEYVRRAGFVLMARLAQSDKTAPDDRFVPFLDCIEEKSSDERNMVKKSVNWALRQIGKRNLELNSRAIRLAEILRGRESKSARWIASDALRELTSEAVRTRLQKREGKDE